MSSLPDGICDPWREPTAGCVGQVVESLLQLAFDRVVLPPLRAQQAGMAPLQVRLLLQARLGEHAVTVPASDLVQADVDRLDSYLSDNFPSP
jgi:hypothetical protein